MARKRSTHYLYNDSYFGISDRIAKWKIPSDFELTLSEAARENVELKSLYSKYYQDLDIQYWTKGKEYVNDEYGVYIKEVLGENNIDKVYDDMVFCLHRYGLSFKDYIVYNLINKSDHSRSQFISDKLRYHYCDILNDPEVEHLMKNKYECYKHYKEFFLREACLCSHQNSFAEIKDFLSRHNKVVFKPLTDHSGHGIKIFNTADINLDNWIRSTQNDCPGIVEEYITQGEELDIINPSSINTCRVVTFKIGEEIIIFAATLRMGIGHSITDNAGSGGIYANIDPETGIICTDARDFFNNHYIKHPSTNFQILGFQLPEWEEAKKLVRKMASYLSGTTLIAWDIAYSTKGWCMVEANENGAWRIIQSNREIGLKPQLYELMDRYFEYKKYNK